MGFPATLPFRLPTLSVWSTLVSAWDELVHVASHEAEGVNLLLEQFKGKPIIEALLSSYLRQVQDLENAFWDLLTLRGIDSAFGAQLDGIGRIVLEPRRGRDDEPYRAALRVRIRILRTNGRAEDVLDVLTLFEQANTGEVGLRELYPASMVLTLRKAFTQDPAAAMRALRKTKAGGVSLQYVYAPVDIDHAFIGGWSGTYPQASLTQGAGWSGDTSFGGIAGEAFT